MRETRSSNRSAGIDLTKALAICAVLFIHCTAGHYACHEVGSPRWLAADFYGSVSRWAVPVFMLCSGALMNDPNRELPLQKLFGRYLLRLAASLAVWAVFYEAVRLWLSRGSAPLGDLLRQAGLHLLYGNTYYHLYYFWFVFALYLALPATRLIARYASEKELRYLLAVWLLGGGALQFLRYFWPVREMKSSLHYLLIPGPLLCPGLGLLGWYLYRHPPKKWYPAVLTFLLGLAVTFFGTWRRSAAIGQLDQFYLDGLGLFVLVMAAGLFRFCQWAGTHWTNLPRLVGFISSASFCIYLVHPFFQALAKPSFFLTLPVYFAVPAQAGLLLVLSGAAYCILRRIPVVNRWLI